MTEKVYTLQKEIDALVADRHERYEELTRAEDTEIKLNIRSLRDELQAELTAGANPCPECGRHPIGIVQPGYFFVGCTSQTCSNDRRSKGRFIAEAVENWNDEVYFERADAVLTKIPAE